MRNENNVKLPQRTIISPQNNPQIPFEVVDNRFSTDYEYEEYEEVESKPVIGQLVVSELGAASVVVSQLLYRGAGLSVLLVVIVVKKVCQCLCWIVSESFNQLSKEVADSPSMPDNPAKQTKNKMTFNNCNVTINNY